MRRRILAAILIFATAFGPAYAQSSRKARTKKKRATRAWVRVLNFTGITATPANMRGAPPTVSGQLWIGSAKEGASTSLRLTAHATYRTPVFSCDGSLIYTLRGEQLVAVTRKGKATDLAALPRVATLIGIDKRSCDALLVTLADRTPAVLSLATFALDPISLTNDEEDDEIRGLLSGDTRYYGGVTLLTKKATDGTTDVYVQNGSVQPSNISNCRGRCVQPSLFEPSMIVVFVRVVPVPRSQ